MKDKRDFEDILNKYINAFYLKECHICHNKFNGGEVIYPDIFTCEQCKRDNKINSILNSTE